MAMYTVTITPPNDIVISKAASKLLADWVSKPLLQHWHPQPVLQAAMELSVMEVQAKIGWRHHVKPITCMRDGGGKSQSPGLSVRSLIKETIEAGLVNNFGQGPLSAAGVYMEARRVPMPPRETGREAFNQDQSDSPLKGAVLT